ncbi:hypothetical protein DTL42_25535 [Bremerella cremea]|uniref:Uncharacterized protein n=1 Tax=Bremerella cremea TaxID=1031537 RepID=A0A368KM65_9BACT|nr:hypothetical protein DTL42_25535 [Bremerella cremea]
MSGNWPKLPPMGTSAICAGQISLDLPSLIRSAVPIELVKLSNAVALKTPILPSVTVIPKFQILPLSPQPANFTTIGGLFLGLSPLALLRQDG